MFEIGILRSKLLGVRWTPEGRNKAHIFIINQNEISAEKILSKIIKLHRQYLLSLIYKSFISSPTYSSIPQLITPLLSETKLKVELAPCKTTFITVEHLTGRIVFENQSDLIKFAERTLNAQRDVSQMALNVLVSLRHLSMQQELESTASECGWNTYRVTNIRPEDIRQKFGVGIRQISTLRKDSWRNGWFIIVTFSDTSVRWWLAELKSEEVGWTIPWHEHIKLFDSNISWTKDVLERLAILASSRIIFHAITQGLQSKGIRYKYSNNNNNRSQNSMKCLEIPRLIIDASSLTKSRWTRSALYISFQLPQDGSDPFMILLSKVTQSLAWKSISSDLPGLSINPKNGMFALRFDIKDDEKVLDLIIEKISRIERVVGFIETLRSSSLHLMEISMSKVTFCYGKEAIQKPSISKYQHPGQFSASILLSGERMMSLILDKTNPHKLIQHFLQDILNVEGFHSMITMLQITLPILEAAHRIDRDDVYFLAHSVVNYRIVYQRLQHCFDASIARKNGKILVYITDSSASMSGFSPATVCTSLWNTDSDKIIGLEEGVVCEMSHVQEAMVRLNDLLTENLEPNDASTMSH